MEHVRTRAHHLLPALSARFQTQRPALPAVILLRRRAAADAESSFWPFSHMVFE
jgi:phosphoheptose isomerase